MSFVSLYFLFNDIKSSDMGINIVKIDESGFFPTPISGSKTMTINKVAYRDIGYRYKTDLEYIQFDVTLCPLEGEWTDRFKYEIFKWLGVRKPCFFQTTDYIGKAIPCICTNAIDLMTVGTSGYVKLNFQATTPYWFSYPMSIVTCDMSSITSPTFLNPVIENKSNVQDVYLEDFYYYPEQILIDLKGTSTGVTLTNYSDGGRVFSFTNCQQNESLVVNNQVKEIISSTGLNRIPNFNKNWLRLIYGQNQILCSNKCIIQFKMMYPIFL